MLINRESHRSDDALAGPWASGVWLNMCVLALLSNTQIVKHVFDPGLCIPEAYRCWYHASRVVPADKHVCVEVSPWSFLLVCYAWRLAFRRNRLFKCRFIDVKVNFRRAQRTYSERIYSSSNARIIDVLFRIKRNFHHHR